MRILIIDDNAHHAELAARRLMKEGWEVFVTDKSDPRTEFKRYDFILVDYSMPSRSGLDVLRGLKELEITTPVIMLTGHGNEIIASEAIKQGAYDYVVKDTQLLYLERLPSVIREAKSKHELIETNRFLINELRRANERLQTMTFTDEMTGISNYRYIRKQLDSELKRAARYKKPLSLCVIDVDFFKKINDTYGHSVGDAALKEVARILKENTRTVDVLGRYGGDEFVIVFPDTELSDAYNLCERIRNAAADQTFNCTGKKIRISLSIGLADFDLVRRKTPEDLLDAADRCLYQAKRAGRNRVAAAPRLVEKRDSEIIVASPS